jgi:hypothetical protein
VRQGEGVSTTLKPGFASGVFRPADSLIQFGLHNTVYLNLDPSAALYPGPLTRPWGKPKVLANVARLSRGPWRLAAAFDVSGLVASQGFFGLWPDESLLPGPALEAVLNGPLANAFLTEHASNQHLTNELLKQLPIPKRGRLQDVVSVLKRYRDARVASAAQVLRSAQSEAMLGKLLVEVDAEVLKAYDLPPRLERRLLEFFRGHEHERRVGHAFEGWIPKDFTAYIPLHEYIGPLVQQNRGPWALEVFTPAPDEEVETLKQYVS